MGRHYSHLSLEVRRKIAKWLEAKMPVAEMADRLGRDVSTIYRDIKRNRYTDFGPPELKGYYAISAQDMFERRRAIHRKTIVRPRLKAAIEDRLKAGWSPEQIAGRTRLEHHPIRARHESIYRFAHSRDGRPRRWANHPNTLLVKLLFPVAVRLADARKPATPGQHAQAHTLHPERLCSARHGHPVPSRLSGTMRMASPRFSRTTKARQP